MEIDVSTCLIRKYALRTTAQKQKPGKPGYFTLEVTFPQEAAERECRRLGLTMDELIERYQVVWYMGQFPGLYLAFEEKEKKPAEVSPATAGVETGT